MNTLVLLISFRSVIDMTIFVQESMLLIFAFRLIANFNERTVSDPNTGGTTVMTPMREERSSQSMPWNRKVLKSPPWPICTANG